MKDTTEPTYHEKLLIEIGQKLAAQEVTLADIKKQTDKVTGISDLAKEAHDKAESAHARLDGLFKFIIPVASGITMILVSAVLGLILTK